MMYLYVRHFQMLIHKIIHNHRIHYILLFEYELTYILISRQITFPCRSLFSEVMIDTTAFTPHPTRYGSTTLIHFFHWSLFSLYNRFICNYNYYFILFGLRCLCAPLNVIKIIPCGDGDTTQSKVETFRIWLAVHTQNVHIKYGFVYMYEYYNMRELHKNFIAYDSLNLLFSIEIMADSKSRTWKEYSPQQTRKNISIDGHWTKDTV